MKYQLAPLSFQALHATYQQQQQHQLQHRQYEQRQYNNEAEMEAGRLRREHRHKLEQHFRLRDEAEVADAGAARAKQLSQHSSESQLELQLQYQQPHYLTIEDIKSTRNSCWLCGCNWLEEHVSLDCPECDGYALSRPCPSCDGKCEQTWTRNISATHDRHKALWTGQCKFASYRTNKGQC